MKDISEASFVAVEVDDITDVTQKAQISVIFRYVNEKLHKIKEAFLGFDDVSDDRRADVIARYILDMLEKFNCLEKLVSQTYDVASEHRCALLELSENFSPQNTCSLKNNRKRLFYNILDDIIVQLQSRFGIFSNQDFVGLVNCSNFFQMSCEFDDKKLQSLLKSYAKFFDPVKLKANLSGLYSSQTVRNECSNPSQLLSFLHRNDLIQTVHEATKLLKLVLTLPATTASVERSFSALKRIKTYSKIELKKNVFRPLH